jgi:hypothetical protein
MEAATLVPITYGLMAEFDTPEQLVAAARLAYDAGYRKLDSYSPMPVHGVFEAMGYSRTWMPQLVLGGGLTGCAFGYGLCFYMTVIAYAHNTGGRPVHSWPAYIPITFECTVLFAAAAAVFGMLALNRLPMPYHPVFNGANFLRASQDGFFLCIQADDPLYDPVETRAFLAGTGAKGVSEVED